MKRSLLITFILLIFSAASCKKKGCTDEDANNYDPSAEKDDGSCYFENPEWLTDVTIGEITYQQLSDTIYEDITLTAEDNWMISGGVFVADGYTMTIEEGTTIYAADDGTTPFLSILPGAQLNACATIDNPIVFTTIKSSPAPGDWGGIILNGNANINEGTTTSGPGGMFGGSDDAYSAGTLCYIRVEYAGKDNFSGFSFNACGYGTNLRHLQAYKCAGDGITFLGGRVHLKYAVSNGNYGNAFSYDLGWSGFGQYWVAEQSTNGGNHGIYGSNNKTDNLAEPISDPSLSNVTLIGADDGDGMNQGVFLSEGTSVNLSNTIVTGFPYRGVHIESDRSISYMTGGSMFFHYSLIDNNFPFEFTSSSGSDTVTVLMFDDETFENEVATDGSLVTFLSGYVGTYNESTYDPTVVNPWFNSTGFRGAVRTENNWTESWVKPL